MAMTINTNVVSINAQRNLSLSGNSLGTTMQRLSSGLRVNSAKDDAAGLAIAERMNAQSKGLAVAARNANDGISLAQTAEGALGKVGDMLQRMRELAVQSSNATNSADDRKALQAEVDQLRAEIDRVAKTTSFNGQKILDGSFSGGVFQVGAGAGDNITVGAITNAKADALSTATYGASSQTVKAAGMAAFDGVIKSGELSIRVGTSEAVALGEIAAANSPQERLGQVVAAINAKTADTGVTAFLEEGKTAGEFTVQIRSNSGDVVSLQGFNAATTGIGGAVTVGLPVAGGAGSENVKDRYDAALTGLTSGFAALSDANFEAGFVTDGTGKYNPDGTNGGAVLKAVATAFTADAAKATWGAAMNEFQALVEKNVTFSGTTTTISAEQRKNIEAGYADLQVALQKAAYEQGADARKAVNTALDAVLKLDATTLKADWNSGAPVNGTAKLDALNDALVAAGATGAQAAIAGLSFSATPTAEELEAARQSILAQVDSYMSGDAGVQVAEAKKHTGLEDLDISTQAGAWEALTSIDSAIDQVNAARADLGALQTRFEKTIENIDIMNENISAARGRIVDADFATETANLSRSQILQQAGTAMVAQANQLPQQVLSLLQ